MGCKSFFFKKSFPNFNKSFTFFFMTFQDYSKSTVLKALHWLDKQPGDWVEHIKDTNIAVKMYLKSKNKKKDKSPFQKEIQKLLKPKSQNLKEDRVQWASPAFPFSLENSNFNEEEPIGAVLQRNQDISLKTEKKESSPSFHSNDKNCYEKAYVDKDYITKQNLSPPASCSDSYPLSGNERDKVSVEEENQPTLSLDKISWETLNQAKKNLNIKDNEEALRLLIQLGKKSLEQIFPSSESLL